MTACSQANALQNKSFLSVFNVTGGGKKAHYIEYYNRVARRSEVIFKDIPGFLHSVVADEEYLYLLTTQDSIHNGPDRVGLYTLRLPGLDEPKLVVTHAQVRLTHFAFLTIHNTGVYSMAPTGPVRLLDHDGEVDIVYFNATDEEGNPPSHNRKTRIGFIDGYALVLSSDDKRFICIDLTTNTKILGPTLPFAPYAIYHSDGNDVLCSDMSDNLYVVRVHIVRDAEGGVDVRADVIRSIPIKGSHHYAYVVDNGEIWIVRNSEWWLRTTYSSADDRGRTFTVRGGYFRDGVISTQPLYRPAR